MSNNFNDMDNEQFREYLKGKYGERYLFATLTQEEFDRAGNLLSEEEIREALKLGAEERRLAQENMHPPLIDHNFYF